MKRRTSPMIVVDRNDGERFEHPTASKWVIDDERQLHIIGESGNLASYSTGAWASVFHATPAVDELALGALAA